MSSLFHESEEALANMALSDLAAGEWDAVVGGLGLGYTAAAALKSDQVKRLVVVEALGPVIAWHKADMVPNGRILCDDSRCIFHQGDFLGLLEGVFDQAEGHRVEFHTPLLQSTAENGIYIACCK